MIYLGDGETDIPSMKLVKSQGGYSVAVYDPVNEKKKKDCLKLMDHKRVSCVCPADYSKDSRLDIIVQNILKVISANAKLQKTIEESAEVIQQVPKAQQEPEQNPDEMKTAESEEVARNESSIGNSTKTP